MTTWPERLEFATRYEAKLAKVIRDLEKQHGRGRYEVAMGRLRKARQMLQRAIVYAKRGVAGPLSPAEAITLDADVCVLLKRVDEAAQLAALDLPGDSEIGARR